MVNKERINIKQCIGGFLLLGYLAVFIYIIYFGIFNKLFKLLIINFNGLLYSLFSILIVFGVVKLSKMYKKFIDCLFDLETDKDKEIRLSTQKILNKYRLRGKKK